MSMIVAISALIVASKELATKVGVSISPESKLEITAFEGPGNSSFSFL